MLLKMSQKSWNWFNHEIEIDGENIPCKSMTYSDVIIADIMYNVH